jgi:hypothetical protein
MILYLRFHPQTLSKSDDLLLQVADHALPSEIGRSEYRQSAQRAFSQHQGDAERVRERMCKVLDHPVLMTV